jgi:hypothetical protein
MGMAKEVVFSVYLFLRGFIPFSDVQLPPPFSICGNISMLNIEIRKKPHSIFQIGRIMRPM